MSAQWQPGQSGNPAGRPRGIVDRRSKVHAAFEGVGEEIAQVVVARARAGDMQAANIVLQRISPPLKPRGERVRFTLDAARPLVEQSAAVIQAVADGDLSPDEAQIVLSCISVHCSIQQADEMARRLEDLERRFGGARTAAFPMIQVRPYESPDGVQLPQLQAHRREPALAAPSR